MKKYRTRKEPCGTVLHVHQGKKVIPTELRTPLMRWYHDRLIHAAAGRIITTIRMHFYWFGMDREISKFCETCKECQINKKTAKRLVGHLQVRPARSVTPWERIHVNGIGKRAMTYT